MRYNLGGTVRAATAAQTLAMLKNAIDAVGITRLANVTGLDRVGIPVALCIRPNSKHLSVSQGKGVTLDLAIISAAMESIEGFHAENPPPPDLEATMGSEMNGATFVDPLTLLPGFRSGALQSGRPLKWIRGFDLVSQLPAFLPHVLVDLDSSRPHPDLGVVYSSSNGLASGNTMTEAILHSIFEIVERDSEERWIEMAEEERDKRRISIASIDDPMLSGLLAKFTAADLAPALWDTTSRTSLPSFRCILSEISTGGRLGSFHGSGCHLSKPVAMARALTEAAQTRLTLIAGSRDDLTPHEYGRSMTREKIVCKETKGVSYGSISDGPIGNSLEEDLRNVVAAVSSAGFKQIVVVDLTRRDLGIPVVFTAIPGARFNGLRI